MDANIYAQLVSIFDPSSDGIAIIYDDMIQYTNYSLIQICKRDFAGERLISMLSDDTIYLIYKGLKSEDSLVVKDVNVFGTKCNIRVSKIAGGLLVAFSPLSKEETVEKNPLDTMAELSREFRAPLTLIFSALNLLSKRLPKDPDGKLHNYLSIINHNCYRILKISNNIFDLAQLIAPNEENKFVNADIVFLLKNFVTDTEAFTMARGVPIKFDSSFESLIIAIDPNRINRLLLNLVSNSLKYTRDGNEISIRLTQTPDNVIIHFSDLGKGIPVESLPYIFGKIKNDNEPLNDSFGLNLVKSIIESHGGRMMLESKAGEGTSITLSIPNRTTSEPYVESNIDSYLAGFSIELMELCEALPSWIYNPVEEIKKN